MFRQKLKKSIKPRDSKTRGRKHKKIINPLVECRYNKDGIIDRLVQYKFNKDGLIIQLVQYKFNKDGKTDGSPLIIFNVHWINKNAVILLT